MMDASQTWQACVYCFEKEFSIYFNCVFWKGGHSYEKTETVLYPRIHPFKKKQLL